MLKVVRLGQNFGAEGVEVLAGIAPGERVATDPIRAGLAGAPTRGQWHRARLDETLGLHDARFKANH